MADGKPTHNFRIFLASFLTIFAAGVGFGVRTGVLAEWGAKFGFTQSELGTITGGGLTGFGIVIILASLFLDKVGYKPILMLAFLFHLLSAGLTLAASGIYASSGQAATYQCLYWAMFLFAVGNGLCEAAVNPLVATLYPTKKTHYLNILHASWPAGLVIGSLIGNCFLGKEALIKQLDWEVPMGLFLVPVLLYGLLIVAEKLPKSEASAAGVSMGQMFAQFAAPLLLLLLLLHAMVGYVELGTDSWITNIMKNTIGKTDAGNLFMYTCALMFVLRFFAGPIVERINPLGLLTLSGLLGFCGLQLLSRTPNASLGWAFMAATVYGLGKTFLWPTMLGVVGERFPRGGALVMGAMGGIGMLSAGELGGPLIGYKQDHFAQQKLEETSKPAYDRYAAGSENSFHGLLPPVKGLDGAKVTVLNDDANELKDDIKKYDEQNKSDKTAEKARELGKWWDTAQATKADDAPLVTEANLFGGRRALQVTSFVPLTMAVLYFLIVLYFASKGGYKQVHIDDHQTH
jgi:fucose permease